MELKIKHLFQVITSSLLFLPLILSLPLKSNFLDYNFYRVFKKQENGEILYISRHDGTISNFNYIAEQLNFNITTLYPNYKIGKKPDCYNEDKCKSFVDLVCSQYDYIVISDIIPDSYIYFTNECNAKVVLEITNRLNGFIYNEEQKEYNKDLAKAISNNKNLIIVENNPYEVFFACQSKINIPNYYLIRPVGYPPSYLLTKEYNEVHDELAIIKNSIQVNNTAIPMLQKYGVKFTALNHGYGGPLALATYKAVIMLPYQVSIMKIYENIRYGVVMLCPSERLFKELCKGSNYGFAAKDLLNIKDGVSNYVEFYNKEFRDLIVYFDKWEDIPEIIKTTNFDEIREKCKKYSENYEKKALNLWSQVLGLRPQDDMIKDKQPLCDQTEFLN